MAFLGVLLLVAALVWGASAADRLLTDKPNKTVKTRGGAKALLVVSLGLVLVGGMFVAGTDGHRPPSTREPQGASEPNVAAEPPLSEEEQGELDKMALYLTGLSRADSSDHRGITDWFRSMLRTTTDKCDDMGAFTQVGRLLGSNWEHVVAADRDIAIGIGFKNFANAYLELADRLHPLAQSTDNELYCRGVWWKYTSSVVARRFGGEVIDGIVSIQRRVYETGKSEEEVFADVQREYQQMLRRER